MKGIQKLKAGTFTDMSQDWQDDGTVVVTLSKRGEGKVYVFHVYDLYGPDEEVLSEETHKVK